MNWLDPLIDPGSFVPRAQREEKPDPTVGLALLLEGRVVLYRAVAERAGWPDLGTRAGPDAEPGTRLLAAVGLHLTGAMEAEAEYERLLRGRSRGMATLATLLLSFLYSDSGRGADAVALLRRRLRASNPQRERALLQLQLGMRLAELADFVSAIDETQQARGSARPTKATGFGRALDALAAHNLFAYRTRAGLRAPRPTSLPRLSGHESLVRTDLLYADGLGRFLETSFERSLADPYTRTVRFQAADPIEAPLRGALTRAELLSEYAEVRRARKLFGRYLVISRLGTRQGVPAAALELLRRAGDTKGIEAASKTIWRTGPLLALRLAAEGLLAQAVFAADEPSASLQLLARGADLLAEPDAAEAVAQLIAQGDLFAEHWSIAPRTLAELTKSAPAATQTEVAAFVGAMLDQDGHAGFIQALSQIVEAIRWAEVDADERESWISFIRASIGSASDAHFVALRAVMALAAVEPEAVGQILHKWFDERRSVEAIAVTLDSFDSPPAWARRSSWPLVSEALARIREDAVAGTYGFGLLDIGNLALGILRYQPPKHPGWNELVDFLLDPRVGISAKTRALDQLGRPDTRMPREVGKRLRGGIADLEGFVDQLGSPRESFVAAKLRLAARVGGIQPDAMLVGLLDLAGSVDAVGRIAAAGTLPAIQKPLGLNVALTTGLMLAHDANPDVRAAAARSLAQFSSREDKALDEARRERLADLLGEPGVVVPYGVLAGLFDAATSGGAIDKDARSKVAALAEQHPSRTVRAGAQTLLEYLDRR